MGLKMKGSLSNSDPGQTLLLERFQTRSFFRVRSAAVKNAENVEFAQWLSGQVEQVAHRAI